MPRNGFDIEKMNDLELSFLRERIIQNCADDRDKASRYEALGLTVVPKWLHKNAEKGDRYLKEVEEEISRRVKMRKMAPECGETEVSTMREHPLQWEYSPGGKFEEEVPNSQSYWGFHLERDCHLDRD